MLDSKLLEHIDPSLRYRRVLLPEEVNALGPWTCASEHYVDFDPPKGPDEFVVDWYEEFKKTADKDVPFPIGKVGRHLTHWLDSNQKALKFIDEGIKRGKFQFSEITKNLDEKPNITAFREFSWLKLSKAKKLVSEMKFEAAGRETEGALSVGKMISRGEGALIHYLVGISIQTNAMKQMRWIADQRGIQVELLSGFIEILRQCENQEDDLEQSLKVEICEFVPFFTDKLFKGENLDDWVDALISENWFSKKKRKAFLKLMKYNSAPFDKAETLRLISDFLMQIIWNNHAKWKYVKRGLLKEIQKQIEVWPVKLYPDCFFAPPKMNKKKLTKKRLSNLGLKMMMVHNPIGKMLVSLLAGLDVDTSFRLKANLEATRVILAVKIYQIRKGKLPKRLEKLVDEKILDRVPMDPFSDEPLRYSRKRRIIWSVGMNGKDGGVPCADDPQNWEEGDVVWKVPMEW